MLNVLRECGNLYFHFAFGLMLIVLGVVTIVSRMPWAPIVRTLLPWHAVLGSMWFYGVLMQTATSLWCRKDGFKWFIFLFMMILVINMIIGHACIRIYMRNKPTPSIPCVQIGKLSTDSESPYGELEIDTAIDDTTATELPVLCGLPLVYFKYMHGFCMCLAYAMLFGAGVMFTRRSKDLVDCVNAYSPDDAVFPGAVFYMKDGALYIGGSNFTAPSDADSLF